MKIQTTIKSKLPVDLAGGNTARSHRQTNLSPGFTLVEMMLVVTIIGILAALVIPKIAGKGEQARVTAAQTDIKAGIKTALDSYEVDNGFYPKSLQDLIQQPSNARNWHGPYFDRRNCRWIRGAIPTFITIPASTMRVPTICCRSGRTARKARTTTSATGPANEIAEPPWPRIPARHAPGGHGRGFRPI
jgi:prepilin-type N-terminal cleavage/methylation domain-containing protein